MTMYDKKVTLRLMHTGHLSIVIIRDRCTIDAPVKNAKNFQERANK